MQFFDLVAMSDDSANPLAKRLGYKKIFGAGTDVDVVERVDTTSPKKKILRSDDFEAISKALRRGEFIGIMPKSASVSKKTLEAIKNSESALFIELASVTCADPGSRAQMLVKMRSMIRSVLRTKTQFVLVSLADSKRALLSQAQMVAVAEFFGIPQMKAKEALQVLGGIV